MDWGEAIMDSDVAPMQVVMACDADYAMPLATALRSFVESNRGSWPIEFHMLSDGFDDAIKKRVLDSLPVGSVLIHWVPLDLMLFQGLWTRDDVSKMTFARLMIPKMLPNSISKVLYLDTDILVLGDLKPLWETNLEDSVLGAVLDNLDSHFKSGRSGYEDAPRVQNYFNAGVLLIDLDRWRKEQVSEKALAYMDRHRKTPFMDQDALNVVCDGRWKSLDHRWNFHDCWSRSISNLSLADRPVIAHFVSIMKPWNTGMLSVNACFYDTFRRRTCFARTKSDKLKDCIQRAWARLKRVIITRNIFLRAMRQRIGPAIRM
jgi:lipopolysaccharide biosynthesis glycosyltransferase